MKRLLPILLFLATALVSWAGYKTDPDAGLFFNETNYTLAEPPAGGVYHGLKTALLVAPDDIPARNHYSNSSMAQVSVHVIAPGGGATAYPVEEFREEVYIILEGTMDFMVGNEVLHAVPQDVVFIPPGVSRGFTATGAAPVKVVQADWSQPGPRPAQPGRAFITSERLRPMAPTGGEGYLTATPNPRQHSIPLSINGYGGHVNASNSLLLYSANLTGARPFTANTAIARMGLSEYRPGGGTPAHFHPDREQLFIILAGKTLWEIGANTLEVKPGDIIFAPRHVFHGHMVVGEKPVKFLELEWAR